MRKKTLKWLLLATELFAFYLFFIRSYVLSGCICLTVGFIGVIFGFFGFEFMMLIGLMIISIGYRQWLLMIVISAILISVSIYDLIKIIQLTSQNENRQLSQSEWFERYQDIELLHRFGNKLRQSDK